MRKTIIICSPCGLNADWWMRAWHFGPGDRPNWVDGDVYVLDDEEGAFNVVRSYVRDDDEPSVVDIATCDDFQTACAIASALAANGEEEDQWG